MGVIRLLNIPLSGNGINASGVVTDFWEPTGGPSGYISTMTVANNGDVWVGTYYN